MSLYISNHQVGKDMQEERSYVPILLGSSAAKLKHRIYQPDYEFSKVVWDSFELVNTGKTPMSYLLVPSGCTSLIFTLGNVMSYGSICGAATEAVQLAIPAQTIAYCVRLRPNGFGCFSDVAASELCSRTVPIENYLRHTAELLTNLRRGESFHERNVFMQRYLGYINAGQYHPMAVVSRCAELIQQGQGLIRVSQLAETVGCSERYLNRAFQGHVGVSPKMYSELVQMQFFLKSIITTKPKSLLNTAVTFGYFDQTHMNRSYRKFLDCTASDMRYLGQLDVSQNDIPNAL